MKKLVAFLKKLFAAGPQNPPYPLCTWDEWPDGDPNEIN